MAWRLLEFCIIFHVFISGQSYRTKRPKAPCFQKISWNQISWNFFWKWKLQKVILCILYFLWYLFGVFWRVLILVCEFCQGLCFGLRLEFKMLHWEIDSSSKGLSGTTSDPLTRDSFLLKGQALIGDAIFRLTHHKEAEIIGWLFELVFPFMHGMRLWATAESSAIILIMVSIPMLLLKVIVHVQNDDSNSNAYTQSNSCGTLVLT